MKNVVSNCPVEETETAAAVKKVVRCPQCSELNSGLADTCYLCRAPLADAPQTVLPVNLNKAPAAKPLIPGVRPVVWGGVGIGIVVVFVAAGVGLYRINNPVREPTYLTGGSPWTPRIIIKEPRVISRAASQQSAVGTSLDQQLLNAVSKGDYEQSKKLLDEGAALSAASKNGIPAFVIAANRGHLPIVQLFLDRGCDVNVKMADRSPSGAMAGGWSALQFAAASGREDVLKLLLARGASIRLQSADGSIALNLAATKGQVGTARLLIEAGADVNHKTKDGLTPLLIAADQGHVECVRLLLEKGADINIKGAFGDSALYHAQQKGHQEIAQMLRDAGAR